MVDIGVSGRGTWFKSSFSKDANNCVEVRFTGDVVQVRDSKYRGLPADRPVITIIAADWTGFLALATGAAGSLVAPSIPSIIADPATGGTTLRDALGTELVYTRAEWSAFTAGVTAGEFHIAAA